MTTTVILLLCFLALQIGANALFKVGSGVPGRWWLCFVAGNVLGMSSIYFLMRLYARMDVNVALALAGGARSLPCRSHWRSSLAGGLPLCSGWGSRWLRWAWPSAHLVHGNPARWSRLRRQGRSWRRQELIADHEWSRNA